MLKEDKQYPIRVENEEGAKEEDEEVGGGINKANCCPRLKWKEIKYCQMWKYHKLLFSYFSVKIFAIGICCKFNHNLSQLGNNNKKTKVKNYTKVPKVPKLYWTWPELLPRKELTWMRKPQRRWRWLEVFGRIRRSVLDKTAIGPSIPGQKISSIPGEKIK